MRLFALLLSVVLTAPASAQTLRKPLPSEKEKIRAAIEEGNKALADGVYQAAERRRLLIEAGPGRSGQRLSAVEIDALDPELASEYKASLVTMGVHRKHAREKFDEAIRLTLLYYQIEPMHTSGAIKNDGSAVSGMTIRWNPRFSDSTPSDDENRVEFARVREEDGNVVVDRDAFSHPGFLANILYHESLHFDILLDEGWQRSTEAEPRIQRAALQDGRSLFDLTEKEYRGLVASLAQAQWVAIERQRGNRSPDYEPAWLQDIENNTIKREALDSIDLNSAVEPLASAAKSVPTAWSEGLHSATELLERGFSLSELAEQQQRQAEADRVAQRKIEEAQYRAFLEARQRANDAAWKYLRATVALACSSPKDFAKKASEGDLVEVNMESLEFFFRLSSYAENSGPGSMSRCQRAMMDGLYAAKRPVTAQTLAGWARDWREAHPSLLKKITLAIGDALLAVGGAMTSFLKAVGEALASAPSSNGGGSPTSIERERERIPRTDRIAPGESAARGQAERVNRIGWGGN